MLNILVMLVITIRTSADGLGHRRPEAIRVVFFVVYFFPV